MFVTALALAQQHTEYNATVSLNHSQLSSSRSGSYKNVSGLHSSSQFRLRGSRSFLGSQSSLSSPSKRNLASDSSRLQKPEAQVTMVIEMLNIS